MEELLKMSTLLTEDYLSGCLTNWFEKAVEYTGYTMHEGIGKGESYLSDIYRLTFHGKITSAEDGQSPDLSVQVFLKCFPQNISVRKSFRSHDFFRNEINFYDTVLPRLLQFQSSKNVTEPFNNCPRIFGAITNGKNDVLITEDLNVYGYKSADRQEGIDHIHTKKVLEIFAKFHALSFAFRDQHPKEYEKLAELVPETYYCEKHFDWYVGYWRLLCIVAIDALEKEYPGTVYEKKIREFATDETFKKMVDATNYKGEYGAILHGDSWSPNFLFKYEDITNNLQDVMVIDFQLVRPASPILDIFVFIYSCLTKEEKEKHFHDLLKYYYDILSRQIGELGSDPEKVFSWEVYQEEIKKFAFFGVAFSLESTPMSCLDPEDAFDMKSIKGTEAVGIETVWTVKPIKSKAGRQRLCANIIHAVDNKLI